MFSEMTKAYINRAIEAETENSIKNWGPKYASIHEAYAVLKEEVEETSLELNGMEHKLECIWTTLRNNLKPLAFVHLVEALKLDAIETAMEACQVAAVCEKFQKTIQEQK